MEIKVQQLKKIHDRANFSCGIVALNNYIQQQASQDVKRNIARVYVLTLENKETVIGYYSLSACSILLDKLPEEYSKKLPRYPTIPVTLLGRIAIDERFHGQGYGEHLLIDALRVTYEMNLNIASYAVVVDALDNQAKKFYQHYGFQLLQHSKRRLFLPMKTIRKIII